METSLAAVFALGGSTLLVDLVRSGSFMVVFWLHPLEVSSLSRDRFVGSKICMF